MENNGNISDMLEQILSTEEGKKAYEQLNQIFGEESSRFGNIFGNENQNNHSNPNDEKHSGGFSGIDPEMMLKFGNIFKEMNKNDKNTELLKALKPHLREENQHKVDNAMKIARLISMFPHIKKSGMFEGLF